METDGLQAQKNTKQIYVWDRQCIVNYAPRFTPHSVIM